MDIHKKKKMKVHMARFRWNKTTFKKSSIKLAEAETLKNATEQMEGGEELQQPTMTAYIGTKPILGAISKETGIEDEKVKRSKKIKAYLDKRKDEQNSGFVNTAKNLIQGKGLSENKSSSKSILGVLAVCGGTIAVVIIPVLLVVMLIYNSPFAILFPSLQEGDTVTSVAIGYVNEFNTEVNELVNTHDGYDKGEIVYIDYEGISSTPSNLYDIIAVYMVRHGVGDTATEMNDTSKAWLKNVVDDMCGYTVSSTTEIIANDDGTTSEYSVLKVDVSLKTYRDMITEYGFDEEEIEMLTILTSPDYLGAYVDSESEGIITSQSSLTEEEIDNILSGITDQTQRKVCAYALSKVGYPYSQTYRDSGNYFDCSSLAYYSWKEAGIDIGYGGVSTAAAEAQGLDNAKKTVDFTEIQPGDLIFFRYTTNGRYKNISHVAIYVGNGKVVEAKNEKYGVVYGDLHNTDRIVLIGRPQ